MLGSAVRSWIFPMARPALKKASNSEIVAATLRKAGRPLTAYEVLDALKGMGVSGPPTVYRALDKLIADGRVHRLESLNAFVLCSHSHDNDAAAFAKLAAMATPKAG